MSVDKELLRFALRSASQHGLLPKIGFVEEVADRTEHFEKFLEEVLAQKVSLDANAVEIIKSEVKAEVMRSRSLLETDLSTRVKNILVQANIKTVSDLIKCSRGRLMSINGMGDKCFLEVDDFLRRVNVPKEASI